MDFVFFYNNVNQSKTNNLLEIGVKYMLGYPYQIDINYGY